MKFFASTNSDVPSWLKEHLQNGLPTVGDMFGYLANTGLEFEVLGNETMMQHYAGVILDYCFPFARELQSIQAKKSSISPPVGEGDWDFYYSFLFTLTKKVRKTRKKTLKLELRQQERSDYESVPSEKRIYCIYHKPFPVAHLGKIIPIFAGPAADLAKPEALTDITRCEPRLPNERWSELSAYYKIWREGPRSEVIGFCHYRRLFNFGAKNAAEGGTSLALECVADHSDAFYGEELVKLAKGDVVICARPVDLGMTIWDQYCSVHNSKDWCWIVSRIAANYPCLIPSAASQLTNNLLYSYNMFVTNWTLFDQICCLWFDLLREFERVTPARTHNAYQKRDISFLAERVFDIWIRYRASIGTRIIEVPIFFIESNSNELDRVPAALHRHAHALIVEGGEHGARESRQSLLEPARRLLASRLPDGVKQFLKFHLREMRKTN
jgi:hypothetical protein